MDCMAITLRGGKELKNSKKVEKKQTEAETEKAYQNLTSSEKKQGRNGLSDEAQQLKKQGEVAKEKTVQKEEVKAYQPPIPFPQRLKQSKLDGQYAKFLNVFKKLEINIPFVEALAQMTHYAKFMKDIISKKRKLHERGVVSLSSNCSVIIMKNLPQKMQDPGGLTIPRTIGNYGFGKALCDFSANINLMPLLVVRRLSLRELTPTTMSLQMADRSMAQPEGILEDVLVKVGKFVFPVDLFVIDIEEDKKIPLLLGIPFLATEATLIDVKKGELTLRVGIEEVHFKLNQCLKQHDIEQAKCMRINNVTPGYKEQHDDYMNENSFDDYIFSSFYNDEFKKEELMIETILSLNERSTDNPYRWQIGQWPNLKESWRMYWSRWESSFSQLTFL